MDKKFIFFIGVTGFLGQFWAIKLLQEGHHVIFLARSKEGISAQERVWRALYFVDDCFEKYASYSIFEGDLFSLPKAPDLAGCIAMYNCSGDISFREEDRDRIFRINLDGTRKFLELASMVKPDQLHHVSTAFVADINTEEAREDYLDCSKGHPNPYAESKCLAEVEINAWRDSNPYCQVFIYRPSIVVGDWNGKTSSFFGYYKYMRPYFIMRRGLERKNGINNGSVFIPIHIPGDSGATINIVSVDYVVDMMMRLERAGNGGVYHLTHSRAPNYELLLQEGLEVLRISGPTSLDRSGLFDPAFEGIQEKLRKGVEEYIPYVATNIRFLQDSCKKALGDKFYEHPVVEGNWIRKLLEFAIQHKFQKRNIGV